MLKKTIKFTDFNDVEREEDFYFNLTEAELTEMELGTTGGLAEMIQKIIATKDIPAIISIFKELIMKAYGVKSADGRSFKKSKELLDDFMATEAYSILFMELAKDADQAAAFINGIIPAKLAAQLAEQQNQNAILNK